MRENGTAVSFVGLKCRDLAQNLMWKMELMFSNSCITKLVVSELSQTQQIKFLNLPSNAVFYSGNEQNRYNEAKQN